MNKLAAVGAIAAFTLGMSATAAQSEPRPVITTAAQLPRNSYVLTQKPSVVVTDPSAISQLAKRVDSDVEAILRRFEILDTGTLSGFYELRMQVALLQRRYADATTFADQAAELQEKPARRITFGLATYGLAAAAKAPTETSRRQAFRSAIAARLEKMPADVVQARLKEIKRNYALMSENYYIGGIEAELDPVWAKSSEVSYGLAADLIRTHVGLTQTIQYREVMMAALSDWLERNATQTAVVDVWRDRTFDIAKGEVVSPVTVAIWDTGVDPQQFVTAAKSIGFASDYSRDDAILAPIPPIAQGRLAELQSYLKGQSDLQAALDTPEADALLMKIASMSRADVGSFNEGLAFYLGFVHGTHVASIAADGNPGARILSVRVSFPFSNIPPPILEKDAEAFASMTAEAVAYMRSNHTRIANLSWGFTGQDIEGWLEANNVEPNKEKRQQRAEAIFQRMFTAMTDAMRSAPEILFVIAAGNTSGDVNFVRDMPAGIDLPNVLAVGAADISGAATSFTSMGKSVDLYANGYAVEGTLPGGTRMKLSGSSLASPQVVNAAAKLLALNPRLTTAQLVELLMQGAQPYGEQKLRLVNAKASAALLRKRDVIRK